MRVSDAAEVLGVGLGISSQDLKARWRQLASELHPDRGGDESRFIQAKLAYETLLPFARSREGVCKRCDGKGFYSTPARGFAGWDNHACPDCKGRGRLE